jgi:hypothetical protein
MLNFDEGVLKEGQLTTTSSDYNLVGQGGYMVNSQGLRYKGNFCSEGKETFEGAGIL